MREHAARDAGEPPHQRLAIAEQPRERGAHAGAREHLHATAIAAVEPAQRLAGTVREDAPREPASRQRAGGRPLDPARGERRLREEA